jgi:hypothetical protein
MPIAMRISPPILIGGQMPWQDNSTMIEVSGYWSPRFILGDQFMILLSVLNGIVARMEVK